VLDRLAGVGQFLADTLATIREGRREAAAAIADGDLPEIPEIPQHAGDADDADDSADQPIGKVYFVEFPPPAPAMTTPKSEPDESYSDDSDTEIVLTENPEASLFNSDRERSEWAPPPEMPTWWIRGSVQG
jgi:hypothetical protein